MDPDKVVEAINALHQTTQTSAEAQRKYNESITKQFESMIQQFGQMTAAFGGQRQAGSEDNRRGSNAYSLHTSKQQQFMQLPKERQQLARVQYQYGMQQNEDGSFSSANGYLNLRRNVGLLNLPEARGLLEEGHFQQAGYQVARGLLQSPYTRPLTIPTGARVTAQGLDFARNRVIGQRLGQPNVMGMTGGVMGPGVEDFSSGLGSYVASLTAFPSMFASKTGEPFSMFGGSMAPAVSQGYQMRKEAFMRSLNPFGMMGYQQNLNLIEATRSKGFRSLGETYNVSDSAREIMQKVGIEAGTAIDMIDLAIKRLGMDSKEAQEEMEVFGKMARGAGKGVAQFAQETLQVLNQMSLQNTRGPGSLQASALMSSIPQVQGQGVFNLLNSPTMTGLTMGTMAGQGASMSTLTAMAMGQPFSAGGGRQSLEMASQGLGTYKQFVDQFMQSAPGENQEEKRTFAFNMAAQVFGLDGPMTAERIYEQTDEIQNQSAVLGELNKFKSVQKYGVSGQMNKELGMTEGGKIRNKRAEAAYSSISSKFKDVRKAWKGGKGDAKFIGPSGASGGVTFNDPAGQDNQQFNIFVNRMIAAKRFKTESVDEVYDAADNAGLDPAQVERAADLFIATGRGDEQYGRAAFAKLSEEFDISYGGNAMIGEKGFVSAELKRLGKQNWQKMSDVNKQKYMSAGKKTLDEALERGLIKKPEYQKQLALVNKGEFDPSAFEKRIIGQTATDTLAESRQLVELTDDAKKLLKLIPNREASSRKSGG